MGYTGSIVTDLPDWTPPSDIIAEPPSDKKGDGWQVEEYPPAQWRNWFDEGFYKSIKELDTEIGNINTRLDNIDSNADGIVDEADNADKIDNVQLADITWSDVSMTTSDIAHTDLQSITSDDHHTRYADSEAVDAVNAETSLSVNITGDADTVDGQHYTDIQNWVNNNADVPNADYADNTDKIDNVQLADITWSDVSMATTDISKTDVGLGNVVNSRQAVAQNGGQNVWVQSTQPTALAVGDLWIDES